MYTIVQSHVLNLLGFLLHSFVRNILFIFLLLITNVFNVLKEKEKKKEFCFWKMVNYVYQKKNSELCKKSYFLFND